MVQLLHKMSIRATNGPDKLLSVIKNPVTDHLPIGCKKIVAEVDAKVVNLVDFVRKETVGETEGEAEDGEGEGEEKEKEKEKDRGVSSIAFIIGAMPHGNLQVDYADERVSFSHYPLSAAAACARLTSSVEMVWGIL
eukprot:TRINITY_DN4838_c0_g1_i3.p1 TRINITY_DN4838_c0_g1~~TRINITY_DN4838_c0_g1_i3.p1  ORF type:complete len:137 (+),score=50.67 TRINITY_DN4838_c0_g1_i3:128-538(+)